MINQLPREPRFPWIRYTLTLIVFAAAAYGVLALYQNIMLRKQEALQTSFELTNLTEETVDPAEWGKNFPRQYDSYRRTVDTERTRYGGSDAIPRQRLDENPDLRTIFAGYSFSLDYREERGHAYMLSDQEETERVTQVQQPGACLHCHSSVLVAYRKAGIEAGAAADEAHRQEAIMKGFVEMCGMPYQQARERVSHPVTCLDCHDPDTLALRVTRPAFLIGIANLAKSDDPVPHLPSIERWRKGDRGTDYDPNREASRQELRSLACGQCHVEYYFQGEGKAVTYPWHKGLKVEQMEAYYDEQGFSDWKHEIAGTSVLKAQHPEFETWSQGIHARSGVACADCHMPYIRQGAIKISDHQVRSPLLNISRACQQCHTYPEDEILARAEAIQSRTLGILERAEKATVGAIEAIAAAAEAGASDGALESARALHRQAQWRTDFVNAENSLGFHASQETARILAEAIDLGRRAELEALRASNAGSGTAPLEPETRPDPPPAETPVPDALPANERPAADPPAAERPPAAETSREVQ